MHFDGCDLSKTQRVQYGIKRIVQLHSWEMEFSIQYHVTINSQLNDQSSIRYIYIKSYVSIAQYQRGHASMYSYSSVYFFCSFFTLPAQGCVNFRF
jgi:hypothetical protein